MKNKRIISFLFILICIFNTLQSQNDTSTLSLAEYIENIRLFHPLAKKANLKLKLAAVELFSARGNLDPTIAASWNEKNFDKKLYYRQYHQLSSLSLLL